MPIANRPEHNNRDCHSIEHHHSGYQPPGDHPYPTFLSAPFIQPMSPPSFFPQPFLGTSNPSTVVQGGAASIAVHHQTLPPRDFPANGQPARDGPYGPLWCGWCSSLEELPSFNQVFPTAAVIGADSASYFGESDDAWERLIFGWSYRLIKFLPTHSQYATGLLVEETSGNHDSQALPTAQAQDLMMPMHAFVPSYRTPTRDRLVR
ncbi:hypothetical protein BU15DRAFT_75226 [Melanogaster broomeanus]|nr:hypothetical protein BU15DRAFT_75226 [Melanogaster broomeanus]